MMCLIMLLARNSFRTHKPAPWLGVILMNLIKKGFKNTARNMVLEFFFFETKDKNEAQIVDTLMYWCNDSKFANTFFKIFCNVLFRTLCNVLFRVFFFTKITNSSRRLKVFNRMGITFQIKSCYCLFLPKDELNLFFLCNSLLRISLKVIKIIISWHPLSYLISRLTY